MNWAHPLAAFIGVVIGAMIGFMRGKKPTKLDLTVRFEDSEREKAERQERQTGDEEH